MSDDSAQKGWDSWFGAEQDSSGGERRAPEQDVPAAAPGSEPESKSEQTDWTMPAVREVPEQRQAPAQAQPQPQPQPQVTETQSGAPEQAGEKVPEQTRGTRPDDAQSPDAMATQVVTSPDALATQVLKSPDAMPTQAVDSPDVMPTQVVTSPDALATQVLKSPDAAPTQVVSASQDALPTQVVNSADVMPTQVVSSVADVLATQVVPPVSTQAQAQAQAQPAAPTQAPAAPDTWQPQPAPTAWNNAPRATPEPPQPAQMWGAPQVPQQQAQAQAHVPQQHASQQAYAQQAQQTQQDLGQVPQQGSGTGDWTGWNEQDRRRPSPASAAATAYGNGSGSGGSDDAQRPRSRRKFFLAGGIGAVAIVGLATVLVLNQGSLTGSGSAAKPSGFQPTGTSVTGDAEQTADAFLAAWESGNFKQAAAYTDAPASALAALTAYESGLNLHGLQLKSTGATVLTASASAAATGAAGSSATSTSAAVPSDTAGSVSFSVAATVGLPATTTSATSSTSTSSSASASSSSSAADGGSSSTATATSSVTANWSYSSKLVAYKKNGGWWVQWAPSLVAPNLTAGQKVVSVAVSPSAAEVVDASGNDLSSATDPGVHNIAAALKKSAPSGQGTPGVDVVLVNADGTQVSGSTAVLSQPVNTGVVKTTINPTVEAAAQQAVLKYPDSSMVVLQPSTGNMLAVANNDGANDFALTARIAPGSTNKIITATALLTSGLLSSPSQAVECPKTITVNGTVFANSENESLPANTPFLTDFAVSCNNAFGGWYDKIGSTTLAQTAEKYYGLNQQWNFGTGAAGPYYAIPSSASNGELFQELFGQGQLEAAPLAMASVAATVDTGTFKQPIVVQGASQISATPLPSTVQQDLYQMMKAVTTDSDGTAYNLFSGVSSTVYGKTGTADVGSTQDKPNSWMVVFDPTLDLAIGCVVLDAGYGASFAGPETAAVLTQLQ